MHYKINQDPNKYESKFGIEYLFDMSHFLGLLNNEGVRKSFFEDVGYFANISNDEYVVKEYIKSNMKVKHMYYQGVFINLLQDKDENFVHVFSHDPFLTEEEEISRVFRLNILKTTYKELINRLLTDGLYEREQFYRNYADALHYIQKINEQSSDDTKICVDTDKEKIEEYGKAIRCHMARNKQSNEAKLECFPVLKELIQSKDFFNLLSSMTKNRCSFYDIIYSEKQRELAQFLNTFAGY